MEREKTYYFFYYLLLWERYYLHSLALKYKWTCNLSSEASFLLQRYFLNLLWCSSSLDNLIIRYVRSGVFRSLIFRQIMIKCRTSAYSPPYLCLLSCDCLYLHITKLWHVTLLLRFHLLSISSPGT